MVVGGAFYRAMVLLLATCVGVGVGVGVGASVPLDSLLVLASGEERIDRRGSVARG